MSSSSPSQDVSANGSTDRSSSHLKKLSFDSWDGDGDENELHEDAGDYSYSSRMEELMDDSEDVPQANGDDEEEEEEGFVYDGVDASDSGGYRERLRDILGSEHAPEDDELEEKEVEKSLLHEPGDSILQGMNGQGAIHVNVSSDHTPSVPSSAHLSPSRMVSPLPPSVPGTPSRQLRQFLHPNISRLRSYTPQASRNNSASGSVLTAHNPVLGTSSPVPSHFSSISRSTTPSNLDHYLERSGAANGHPQLDREVFKWTVLQTISDLVYARRLTQKASAILGSPNFGSPTVMAANGMICIGTDLGKILIFDFKQSLKAVCGNESSVATVGPVSALALSHDHTYVASGHVSGHIQLFDISKPQTPARFVAPTSMPAVVAGRQEGHLLGSRIVAIGFVAGRHTAVVTADENGLAFYHSLGKVLFVEASDILRILGKYPEEDIVHGPVDLGAPSTGPVPVANGHGNRAFAGPFRPRRLRRSNAILSMATLPLGTAPHATDSYHIVALLTPMKLVIVGLKPTPKTWFRRHREDADEKGARSKWKGTMAWWPSVTPGDKLAMISVKGQKNGKVESVVLSADPILAYSWADTLYLLRVSETKVVQKVKNHRNGKTSSVEVGAIAFAEERSWTTISNADVLALQWLNANQIVAVTAQSLEVYDVRTSKLVERTSFDASLLVSPTLGYTVNGMLPYADSVSDIAHSVRVYKGKVFLLGRQDVSVGTLLTWADRILALVSEGDFLSAIELTRTYYTGEAPGNRNGLPDAPEQVKDVVGQKLRELMTASARYAFSEERLVETHIAAEGQGVDRTSLFEDLVQTCARACKALDDYDFLFEDLFQYYDDSGITRMFLIQLETFVLDGAIRYVPPRITQRLVAMHDEDGRPDLVERVIWHIEPDCLDINQAVHLCKAHQLYDALIYVYTRAMKDYVAPVVELLSLIRKVMLSRKARMEPSSSSPDFGMDDSQLEPIILNAYKVYPYLGDVLSGLTYPSDEPLPEDEAQAAKNDVYTFLFFGRSSVWPSGEGGRLVLTADEEGGVEPTYPYLRLLLRFDAEAFLHSLDLAFEDSCLNDQTQGVNRLIISNILLEVLSSGGLSQSDVTFINIFLARNIPKYPQYISKYMTPTVMQGILVGLAGDPNESTREDRQLAAECLLSDYVPHDSITILELFHMAGFYRILRSWYRREQQWTSLFQAYLDDTELDGTEVFNGVSDVMRITGRKNAGSLPLDLLAAVSDGIPRLLQISVNYTASLIDTYAPDLHTDAIDALSSEDQEHARFAYLRGLLGLPSPDTEQFGRFKARSGPSTNVPLDLRLLYVELHCRLDPANVVESIKYLPEGFVDRADVVRTCEEHEVYDAAIWMASTEGNAVSSLSKVQSFEDQLGRQIMQAITLRKNGGSFYNELEKFVNALQSVGRAGVAVCVESSEKALVEKTSLEDMWFRLLRSQIDCVQEVSSCFSAHPNDPDDEAESWVLTALRSLVQETFTTLMSISSTSAVSFPRLFKRLVDSSTGANRAKGTPYTEFRAILTGMLESYRSDGDMLFITKHLVDRDVFETTEELVRERLRGWAPTRGICQRCYKILSEEKTQGTAPMGVIISRTGAVYHIRCH